jgi:hypothetical protein
MAVDTGKGSPLVFRLRDSSLFYDHLMSELGARLRRLELEMLAGPGDAGIVDEPEGVRPTFSLLDIELSDLIPDGWADILPGRVNEVEVRGSRLFEGIEPLDSKLLPTPEELSPLTRLGILVAPSLLLGRYRTGSLS